VARAAWTRPWWHPSRWRSPPTREGQPPDGSIDLLWANMALHAAADPQAVIRSWHRMLAVDGFLMFSCFGPDTLRSLRRLYAMRGWPEPAHQFTDMHDWGDMLIQHGFGEPVMDMERITLSFETPARALIELRGLGRNLNHQRFPALRGRQWLGKLHAALEELASPADDGRLTLQFEIIYGHAIKPAERLAVQAETAVPLEAMRAALRRGTGR
jgi:malonyl-CoA O-methyltransferase